MKIPFSVTVCLLLGIAIIGSLSIAGKSDFFESRYTGEVIQDSTGKPVKDVNLLVTISKNPRNFSHDEIVSVNVVDISNGDKASDFVKSHIHKYGKLSCEAKESDTRFSMKRETQAVHINLRNNESYTDQACKAVSVVYSDFNNATMRLGNGLTIKLTRELQRDSTIRGHQKNHYQKIIEKITEERAFL